MAKNDPTQLLKQDHRRVRALLDELESGERSTAELIRELATEVENHTEIEEELFYPAFHRAARGQEVEWRYFSSLEEHNLVDGLLEEIGQGKSESPQLIARCRVVRDLLLHHLKEEESQLFPLVHDMMSAEELSELGEQMAARHAELQGIEPESAEQGQGGGRIDLNTASADELAEITQMDLVRAERLVQYRDEHGPFESWEELDEIEGFGSAMLERLKEEGRLGQ